MTIQPKPIALSVRVGEAAHAKLQAIAAQRERSLGFLIREAVVEWLAKQEA